MMNLLIYKEHCPDLYGEAIKIKAEEKYMRKGNVLKELKGLKCKTKFMKINK